MFRFILALSLLLPTVSLAQSPYKFEQVVAPKPFAISPNIVFVIDASSSINRKEHDTGEKFEKAWKEITERLVSDELYFCVFTFHDRNSYAYRDWTKAGGVKSQKEFAAAKEWVRDNTGLFSFGREALGKAIRKINPLQKNPAMSRTLTVILVTDGGFSEAARFATSPKFDPKKHHPFQPIYDEIKQSQDWRRSQKLFAASIVAIGLENKNKWSVSVKRSDSECQAFLKDIGTRYAGGYFLVRRK